MLLCLSLNILLLQEEMQSWAKVSGYLDLEQEELPDCVATIQFIPLSKYLLLYYFLNFVFVKKLFVLNVVKEIDTVNWYWMERQNYK